MRDNIGQRGESEGDRGASCFLTFWVISGLILLAIGFYENVLQS